MTTALIAEDEPILAATLAHTLQALWPELQIVATCPNGVSALEQSLALRPQVLFLDIKMPGKTGLEAAEELVEGIVGVQIGHGAAALPLRLHGARDADVDHCRTIVIDDHTKVRQGDIWC